VCSIAILSLSLSHVRFLASLSLSHESESELFTVYTHNRLDGMCFSSVLQCVAVCCSVLQCVAVCCSVLQCVAVCCSVSTVCALAICHTQQLYCYVILDSMCFNAVSLLCLCYVIAMSALLPCHTRQHVLHCSVFAMSALLRHCCVSFIAMSLLLCHDSMCFIPMSLLRCLYCCVIQGGGQSEDALSL